MHHHTIDHTLTLMHWLLKLYTYNSDTAAEAEFISSHRRCSEKFCLFHRETSVFESLIYKVASLQGWNFTKKKTPTQLLSCEIWEILTNTYFEKHLNDCFCVLITSSYIDFYNPLQYTIFIFTNNFFFITQLKQ